MQSVGYRTNGQLKKLNINGGIKMEKEDMKKFTKEEHIRKHTKKENTYCRECLFCNPMMD